MILLLKDPSFGISVLLNTGTFTYYENMLTRGVQITVECNILGEKDEGKEKNRF